MKRYTLKWPHDFEDYSWQIESKGWFAGLKIVVEGRTISPTFYDPVRLSQELAADISDAGFFVEPCLIVLPKVTREVIERTVADLARTGELYRLFQPQA